MITAEEIDFDLKRVKNTPSLKRKKLLKKLISDTRSVAMFMNTKICVYFHFGTSQDTHTVILHNNFENSECKIH